MGLGKTIQCEEALRTLTLSGDVFNTLIVCPASLTLMWGKELKKWFYDNTIQVIYLKGVDDSVKLEGKIRFCIVSYNYIQKEKNVKRLSRIKWSAVVADEAHACVHEDTLIYTPNGYIPIKKLVAGDRVYSYLDNELIINRIQAKVDAWGDKDIYIFNLSNGKTLTCLGQHKIQLYDGRWKEAKHITVQSNLRGVSETIPPDQVLMENKSVLFSQMFSKMEMPAGLQKLKRTGTCFLHEKIRSFKLRKKVSRNIKKNEEAQSNVFRRNQIKSKCHVEKDWTQAYFSRGQWENYACSTAQNGSFIGNCIQGETSYGISCLIKGFWEGISKSLQNRLCSIVKGVSRGSRRGFSQSIETKTTRFEKKHSTAKIRVESITLQKQTSDGYTRQDYSDFIDLSLEKPPYNYIASGVVVHNCKNWKSKTCKGFVQLTKSCGGRVWMLTGTPATKDAKDYYPYLAIIQPGKWGTLSEFARMFCNIVYNPWTGFNTYEGVKEEKRPLLRKAFKRVTLRRLKKNVLPDLPDKLIQYIPVEIPANLIIRCQAIDKKQFIREIHVGVGLSKHHMSLMREIGMAKVKTAIDFILNTDVPLVVFCMNVDVLESIHAGIREHKKVCRISGQETVEVKNQAETDFQQGSKDVCLLNIASGGVGITLTRASHALFTQQSWSPKDMLQAAARIDRIGQKNCMNVVHLIGTGTLDEDILEALKYKETFMKEIMGDNLWR